MTRALLSLGSNLGDRLAHLRTAAHALADQSLAISGVYESPPWGDPDQPAYLNAAILVSDPGADAGDWLRRGNAIEERAGRVRDPARRFGPRTLDVDVIAVWQSSGEPVVCVEPDLTLPHPRAHLRAFVLRPWLDIAPYAVFPGHGSVADLLRDPQVAADLASLRARPDLSLE